MVGNEHLSTNHEADALSTEPQNQGQSRLMREEDKGGRGLGRIRERKEKGGRKRAEK